MLGNILKTRAQRSSNEPPERTLARTLKPLISREQKLAVFISAKSGCTFAVKWFLFHCNRLAEAQQHSKWIHNFRQEVLYQEPDYDPALVLDSTVRTVKFVRNPFARAVSSYVHAVRYPHEDDKLSVYLKRDLNSGNRFSFREFIGFLESIDLNRCNPHHRLQMHPAEVANIFTPQFVIKLEHGEQALTEVESKLKLDHAPYAELRGSSHHTSRDDADKNVSDHVFALPKGNAQVPRDQWFYDDELINRVVALYQRDFDAYEYNTMPTWA